MNLRFDPFTTPNPGNPGGIAQTTATYYNSNVQATNITNPDGTSITNEFYPTGLVKRTYGSRTYPVGYGYDPQGRMTKMTNWSGFASSTGQRVTTWNYNAYRGWLDNKRYPDGNGPDYTYTDGGRLRTRTWARTGTGGQRVLTTYSYGFDGISKHGDLTAASYSNDPQSTPSLSYVYDRSGRQKTVTQGSTFTTSLTYNDANEPLTESYSGSGFVLAGLSVTNGYDQFMRRTNVVLLNASPAVLAQTTNNYDTASRLQTVGDGGANLATYSYLANSPLVSQITFKQSGTTRMTTTKSYDFLNRLTQISSAPSVSSVVSFSYSYNNANQRTRMALADGSYWVYEYDSLGQLKAGRKYWADETPVAGQQCQYAFDDIGNRTQSKAGGDGNGWNLRSANYGANLLNQYTNRDVPGSFDVIGLELATNTVTVNSAAPYRKGEYFRKEVSVSNGSVPVWQSVTVSAPNETTVSGNVFVPKTQEQFSYDLDGNLTSDGRWNYTWDAENRLIRMAANNATVGPQNSLQFDYDWKGRRIRKQVWGNTGWSGGSTNDARFLYDGWNLISMVNSSSAVLQSFLWGTDLSGSLQGAGGVGGLLAINDSVNAVHFTAFDGNGNVVALVSAAYGTNTARYEYGPFGDVIRITSTMARVNPLRFSTKYQDDETDFLYYGLRYYITPTGRWANRDRLGETGGSNLYRSFANNPTDAYDILGAIKSGDHIPVRYKGEDIGFLEVSVYSKLPLDGKISQDRKVGAQLWIMPHISCDCCCYKWRQHFWDQWDSKYKPAPPREGRWKYLPTSITEMKDILDIDYSKPFQSEWYAQSDDTDDPPSTCSYVFRDTPSQYPPPRLFLPDSDPERIKKVTVTFDLEFVRVSDCSEPAGGEKLLSIPWGFWYTKTENGLLNNEPR